MDLTTLQFLLIAILTVIVILTGVPIAYGLGALCLAVTITIVGTNRLPLLGLVAYGEIANYSLIAVPLFIYTAEVLAEARISDRAFEAFSRRLHRIPANLGVASSLLSSIFAAIVGSSAGNTAIMGRVALRPMLARGYDAGLASGLIVAGGALGVLIPPSTLMVLYGVVTEVSVGQLLIGGLLPGLLMSFSMIAYVLLVGVYKPHMVGRGPRARATSSASPATAPPVYVPPVQQSALSDLQAILPILLLLGFMTWGIYFGLATSSEIAGIGAAAAILIVVGYRRLTIKALQGSLLRTVQVSAMILLIVVMAAYLGRLLAFMNIGPTVVDAIRSLGWSPYAVVTAVCVFLLFIGCLLDSAAIILVFGPLLHSVMVGLGLDPLWWAVIFVINMEIGLLTPPFGINLFVLKSIAPDIPMGMIVRGVMPLIAIQVVCLVLCIIFPQIITWLPKSMI